jgi:carbonic anhydrase/acetyltransferase-like protein (isoleucine patch superfamily)
MPLYELAGQKPQISPMAFIHPEAVIIGAADVGADCFIGPGAVIRADFGPIRIDSGSSIQDNAVIHVSPGSSVFIGKDVVVAHQAALHDVTIHDRCVVGMGALLLPGVICEDDVFIAAGSVVLQGMHIPAGKMIGGYPAVVIKDLSDEMKAHMATGIDQYKAITRLYRETMTRIDR